MKPTIITSMEIPLTTAHTMTGVESDPSAAIVTEPKTNMSPPAGNMSERLFLVPMLELISRANSPYPVSVNMANAQCMMITRPKTRTPNASHTT